MGIGLRRPTEFYFLSWCLGVCVCAATRDERERVEMTAHLGGCGVYSHSRSRSQHSIVGSPHPPYRLLGEPGDRYIERINHPYCVTNRPTNSSHRGGCKSGRDIYLNGAFDEEHGVGDVKEN